MNNQVKRCPLNRFRKCLMERCAFSTTVEQQVVCSVPFAAHELFNVAEVMMTGGMPLAEKHVDTAGSMGIPAKS